jgi:hypothetical protein
MQGRWLGVLVVLAACGGSSDGGDDGGGGPARSARAGADTRAARVHAISTIAARNLDVHPPE